MDLVIKAHVLAVDVAENCRPQQRVIKGRIEHTLFFVCSTAHRDQAKFLIPPVVGRLLYRVKIPVWNLFVQILPGILDADVRKRDFQPY